MATVIPDKQTLLFCFLKDTLKSQLFEDTHTPVKNHM